MLRKSKKKHYKNLDGKTMDSKLFWTTTKPSLSGKWQGTKYI